MKTIRRVVLLENKSLQVREGRDSTTNLKISVELYFDKDNIVCTLLVYATVFVPKFYPSSLPHLTINMKEMSDIARIT